MSDAEGPVLLVRLEGHLTTEVLEGALPQTDWDDRAVMIVDCSTMTGYDGAARSEFVRWHRAHRERIAAVAVVTEKPLWHLVVSAMSLASGQQMRAFDDLRSARSWVRDGFPRHSSRPPRSAE